ncbi:MAG: tyrosine-type recombinase/integrase [Nanoarchaeota archaeon]
MGIYKKGLNYYIDYYLNSRRIREMIGPSKELAKKVLMKRKIEIAEGKFLDIKKTNKIKFEDFAKQYIEYSKGNKKSWQRDVLSIKNLSKLFSGCFLHEITPWLIEKYKLKRKTEVSEATTNRELACLKHMFTKAIEWNKATENPVKKVKLFKEKNARLRYLSEEEIAQLLKACDKLKRKAPHLKLLVLMALTTGMRRNEMLNLTWNKIEFDKGIIFIENSKNNERREVWMCNTLKQALLNAKERAISNYVFSRKGKPLRDAKTAFHNALKIAGIKDFRFHDLRHTFASHLVMNGTDIATVRNLLGHKDIRMTLRYSHLSPKHMKEAVSAMDKILSLDGHYMDTSKQERISEVFTNYATIQKI